MSGAPRSRFRQQRMARTRAFPITRIPAMTTVLLRTLLRHPEARACSHLAACEPRRVTAKVSCPRQHLSWVNLIEGAVRTVLVPAVAIFLALLTAGASAADRIRLAVQRTGTLAWEIDVIKAHGLDRKANLAIETIE